MFCLFVARVVYFTHIGNLSGFLLLVHARTDIVGRVGEKVILQCQTFENRSQWIRENTVYGDRGIININLPHKDKLKIVGNIQRGEYNLQIENVSRADAGVYKCIKTIDGNVNTTEVLLNIVGLYMHTLVCFD